MTQTESLRLELVPYLEGNMKMRLHPKTRVFVKSELKTLATDLHLSKKNLRLHMQQQDYKVGEQYHIFRTKAQYRAMHVAYSLLRGKAIAQIESKVNPDNPLSLGLVKEYLSNFKKLNEVNDLVTETH